MVTIDPPVSLIHEPQTTIDREARSAAVIEPASDASITDLVKEAVAQARSLLHTEVALAKEEVRREVIAARRAAIEIGIGTGCALCGLTMLLVALVCILPHTALAALITGLGLLALAGILGGLGYSSIPKKPMEETRVRLETDVQIMKENLV